jgi:hypothetical protein
LPEGVEQQHPALQHADLTLLLEEEHRLRQRIYDLSDEATEARRGIRAWLLAPTIAIYQALVRGESVPEHKLRPEGLRRYPVRKDAA